MKCPDCNFENEKDSLFCGNCGTQLPQNKNHSKLIPIICSVAVLVIICGIIGVLFKTGTLGLSYKNQNTTISETDQTSELAPTQPTTNKIEYGAPKNLWTTATSVLKDELGFNYRSSNVLDDDRATCWAEGVAGDGIGESLTISSDSKFCCNGIVIYNGYCKSSELFYKNNRVKSLRFTFDNGYSEIIRLDGDFENRVNNFQFDKIVTKEIKIEILEVYKGSAWSDTCISEIQVY